MCGKLPTAGPAGLVCYLPVLFHYVVYDFVYWCADLGNVTCAAEAVLSIHEG